ncbi:MAG TPA: 5'/3'-nucleotidase SurE, partial [Gammaproteobacteria bacterium]|nr:5'/3'-nucleotidase SurE [Gammaproteobacteria bacterium]
RGRPIYWIGPAGSEADAGPGTDFHAVTHGRVSITPVQVDLTQYTGIDTVGRWLAGLGS